MNTRVEQANVLKTLTMKIRTIAAAATVALCTSCFSSPKDNMTVTPKHWSPTQQSFDTECREGLVQAKALLPTLLAVEGERTIENTLDVYNDLGRALSRSSSTAGLFSEVHPDEQIRELARVCEREVQEFASSLSLDRNLYQVFVGLDTSGYDGETKRLVERTLRDFRRAGVDRDEATRKRIEEIDTEITKLGQSFRKNVSEDVRFIELDSAAQLKGLPEDFIQAHKPGENGKIKITTDYPDYIPFMSYADDNQRRKQLYVEFKNRGADKNAPVLKQMLILRAEKAKILGYDDWANYITEDKMIKSAKNASDFIERVVALAQARAQRDYSELLAEKKKTLADADAVTDYEKSYYENKVKTESYAFDPQTVRPYFPYAQVQKGLLDITSTIYDIEYVELKDAALWHEDVTAYDVVRGDTKLGRIFLDMHPRDGKYKHAAQFTFREGVAGKQLPEGVLVCNFPNPRTAGDALMEHDDVVTMFHEFGHLMHHVLGGHKRWISQSGVATEWDFVEAPSQMFEEWAWSHDTLKAFAKHHETGEVIPKELVERMRRAKKFGVGMWTVQQMFYASISLGFHSVDPNTLDMLATVKELQTKYTPFAYVDDTAFHLSFTHLYGYSAIYYTYMWSLVIAKDMLTPFKQHGLMNTEWTYRYRDKVLVPGGSQDAADLVKDFLGREYNFKAFEEYLGE